MDWYQTFPTGNPTFTVAGMMAYDFGRDRMILYGGFGVGESFPGTDLRTWELYGGIWHPVTTATQPKQWGPGPAKIYAPWEGWMVYDPVREVSVLFFENNDGFLTCETWEYDGTNWTAFGGSTPSRDLSAAVWDPVGEQIVMWGGGFIPIASDTTYYTYDGSAWSSHVTAAAPTGRSFSGLAYDQANSNIVMWGGYTGDATTAETLRPNDTWTLDLSGTPNWTQESPTVIPYFNGGTSLGGEVPQGMTFAQDLGKVVLAAAFALSVPSSTWLWGGTDWEEVNPAVEPPYSGSLISWDAEYGKTLSYGGSAVHAGETWLFPATSKIKVIRYR